MLHRLVATCIIAFWIAMTSLLVIQQMYPETANINAVPMSFVGKLVFQHQQSSDLNIYDKEKAKDVGYVHFQPRLDTATGARFLELSGNIVYTLPGAGGKRIAWSGNIEMDSTFNTKHIHLSVSLHGPGEQLVLNITPASKKVHYIVRSAKVIVDENTITLDEKGISSLLTQSGISPALLAQVSGSNAAQFAPEFSAQQSSVSINGETASTFLLTMKVGGQPLIEAHLSQLGQVIKASAPAFGYHLAPHNVKP